MRVGFDAHMVGQRETGNETYALGLLYGFNRIDFPVDAYTLGSLPESIHRHHYVQPRNSAVRVPLISPVLAARDDLDVFHATYILPPVLPCPGVVTVHDITFTLHPEWFTTRTRLMLDALVPLSMRRASRVITISQHTRGDIIERYNVHPDKIVVTHLAPRPAFTISEPKQDTGQPFFLYVGNIQPRKNIETVVEALRLLKERGQTIPLYIVGNRGYEFDLILRHVHRLRLTDQVHFTGYLPDAAVRHLFATCTALVHPALYEGFGLTPLEAMVQGAPVIAANTSSIPEVVGDAGILLDPYDVESWADAMDRVLQDEVLRHSLRVRGQARVQNYSWERCARETLQVYHLAAGA